MHEQNEDLGHEKNSSNKMPSNGEWDIVSNPFERLRIYRHKVPLIKSERDRKGVYLL